MKLSNLRQQVRRCKRCDLATRLRLPIQKYTDVDLLVLTPDPDYESILEHRPAGGLRWEVWDAMAEASGLGGVHTAFSSLVGCHTYGCPPTKGQVTACGWRLSTEIDIFKPEAIVLLSDDNMLPLNRKHFSEGDFASNPDIGLHYIGPKMNQYIAMISVPDPITTIEKHDHIGGDLHPDAPLAGWVQGLQRVRRHLAQAGVAGLKPALPERQMVMGFERTFAPDPNPRIPDLPDRLKKSSSVAKVRWRAKELSVDLADLQLVRTLFIDAVATKDTGHRIKRCPLDHDWKTYRWHPNLDMIAQHLAGEIVLASFFSDKVRKVSVACIDVDRHNQYQRALFQQTLARLRQMFPRALVVRSSPSGGVHLYLFFAAPQDALKLRALLELKLLKAGLLIDAQMDVQFTEVLVGPGKGVRLPFGYGNWPLADGFGPDSRPAEMLEYLESFIDEKKNQLRIEDVVGAELRQVRRSKTSPEKLLKKMKREVLGMRDGLGLKVGDPYAAFFRGAPEWAKLLYAGGIPTFGTRQRETYSLVKHLLLKDVPEEQVEVIIEHWLRSRNHRSRDWRRDPDGVLEDLPRLVEDVASSLKPASSRRLPALDDVRFLLDASDSWDRPHRYRLLSVGFNLIRFLLHYGRKVQGRRDPRDYFRRKSSPRRSSRPPRPTAPIHWEYLREWGGDAYKQFMDFWKGKLITWTKSYQTGKRPRSFSLIIKAGVGEPAGSLDQALALLLSEAEIKTLFTRSEARRILTMVWLSAD